MWNVATRSAAIELIDEPVESLDELAESFRDITLINRRFGGTAVASFGLRNLELRTLLDVGTGLADIPKAILEARRRGGKPLSLT
jgi:hypothetical protein